MTIRVRAIGAIDPELGRGGSSGGATTRRGGDPGGLSLPRHRAGRLQPTRGGLGDGNPPEGRAGVEGS